MSDIVDLAITVNGRLVRGTAPAHASLLRWVREVAGVTDPKYGCGEGVCGACSVLLDGEPVSSCLVLAAQADGCDVVTASGLARLDGELPRAFLEHHAAQCGFCTPGMLICAAELLSRAKAERRVLGREEIRDGLHGNLCRCTGYGPIVDAIQAAMRNAGVPS